MSEMLTEAFVKFSEACRDAAERIEAATEALKSLDHVCSPSCPLFGGQPEGWSPRELGTAGGPRLPQKWRVIATHGAFPDDWSEYEIIWPNHPSYDAI